MALSLPQPDCRVLVVRLGAMGDILRTLPAVRLFQRRFPAARIGWALDAGWSVLVADEPEIESTVPLPRKTMRGLRAPVEAWRYRAALRGFGADVALDFHGNLRSGIVTRWSGAPLRVGYDGHQQKEGNRLFTTQRVPSGPRRTPRMERNFDLLGAFGIPRPSLEGLPAPAFARAGAERAEAILRATVGDTEFALVSPGVSRSQAYKKPPARLLAAAIAAFRRRGLATLVVWGPGEEEDGRRTVEAADGAALAPATNLPELAALTARARVFASGDTGPMHLACASHVPVLAFYGPTDPVVNQPWGVPFESVYDRSIEYTGIKRVDRERGGFDGVAEADVREAAERLLDASA